MSQTAPAPAPPPGPSGRVARPVAGWLLDAAKVVLAFAAVLLALIVVVGAAALLVGWTAAAIRHTVPPQIATPSQEASGWRQVAIWAHQLAGPATGLTPDQASWLANRFAAREAAVASEDDAPLREFADRCVLRAAAPATATVAATDVHSHVAVLDLQALGRALYWGRFTAAAQIEENRKTLQFLTWAGILIGLITTVLVGLRASKLAEGDGFWPGTITVLAIAFPAIGTAVAAFLAFYSPREEIARSWQQLAALRGVHVEIAKQVNAIACSDRDAVLRAAAKGLPRWVTLYQEAQAAALAATAAAVVQPAGGGSSAASAGQGRPPTQ